MQITGGKITGSSGSPTVTGDADVDWSQVAINNYLIVGGGIYLITSVNALTKTLTVSPVLASTFSLEANYVIARDFTKNKGLPLLNPGDREAALLFSRAMNILDSGGAGGVVDPQNPALDNEVPATKTAHGFIVGSVLRYDGVTGWTLATSTTLTSALCVGLVSRVVDANNFYVKTNGLLENIASITLTPGTAAYLRDTPVGSMNLTNSPGTDSTLKLPIIAPISANSGYIISLGSARPAVFSYGADGLVPAPGGAGSTRFLREDATWQTSALGNNAVELQHMKHSTVADPSWTDFVNQVSGSSVTRYIYDLHTRLSALSGGVGTNVQFNTVKYNYTSMDTDATPWSGFPGGSYKSKVLTIPAGITRLFVYLISGSIKGTSEEPAPMLGIELNVDPAIDNGQYKVVLGPAEQQYFGFGNLYLVKGGNRIHGFSYPNYPAVSNAATNTSAGTVFSAAGSETVRTIQSAVPALVAKALITGVPFTKKMGLPSPGWIAGYDYVYKEAYPSGPTFWTGGFTIIEYGIGANLRLGF